MTPRLPLIERIAGGAVKTEDVPLAERVAEFRAEADDPDWRRLCIRVAVGLDDVAELAAAFADIMTGCERLLGLPADVAQRHANAAWAGHQAVGARYALAMHDRLRWLLRSGASEAAVMAAAEAVDKRFDSPLAPGDFAVIELHFGRSEAQRRASDWRTAIAGIVEGARAEPGGRRRAG